MRKQYLLIGMLAGLMLALAGCGSGKNEETETSAEAAQETEDGAERKSTASENSEEMSEDELAELIGEDAAKLFAALSDEERAAMIPETEVTGMGYYKYFPGEEDPNAQISQMWDYEITGYMEEYEVIRQDWECIVAKGIVSNGALMTEEPVEVTYFFSVNEDETAVILTSATIMDEADSVHIIPTVPFPEAEDLLEMGLSIDVTAPNAPLENLPLTKDNVTEIWYEEEDLQNEMADWAYTGDIHYIINGVECLNFLELYYKAYDDENAEAKWVPEDPVLDIVKAEKIGMD